MNRIPFLKKSVEAGPRSKLSPLKEILKACGLLGLGCFGVLFLVAALAAGLGYLTSKTSTSTSTPHDSSDGGKYPSRPHTSHKSDRELIRDYAKAHYENIERLDIENYTDGSYQVQIYQSSGPGGLGYKSATYKVGVGSSEQQITSWEYVGE